MAKKMTEYRPIRDCIRRKKGLESGIPLKLRTFRDPIFDLIPIKSKIAVEIGSQQGWFAWRILKYTDMKLYCVDPWITNNIDGDGEFNFSCWKKNTNSDRAIPLRGKSIEQVEVFKNTEQNSIDFLFIDGDHTWESVLIDLENWIPLVRQGGLISGHDWNGDWAKEVQRGIKLYRDKYKIMTKLNHAIIYSYTGNKLSAECWWWYKE